LDLLGTEGVADRSAHASNVVGTELGIVMDKIQVCLRPDEKAVPEVVTDAAVHMHQQVITADVGGATRWVTTITGRVVETYAFAADPAHELSTDFLTEPGREYGVEVVKNGTKFLVVVIKPLFGSDRNFSVEAEAVLENNVGAEAGVGSPLFRGRQVNLRGAVVLGGEYGAVTNGNVNLLSMGETGKQKNCTRGCD